MKKIIKTVLSAVLITAIFSGICVVASCTKPEDKPDSSKESGNGSASDSVNGSVESSVNDSSNDSGTGTVAVYYTVSFESNGGSEVSSQQVEAGEHAVEPEDPVKSGYSFDGWYTAATLSTLYDFINTAVIEDITLYAGWKEIVPISGEGNENEGTATFYWNYDHDSSGVVNDAGDIYLSVTFTYGTNISKVSDPVREGYGFGGWYLENGDTYNRLAKYREDVDVYAKWFIRYTFEAERTQLTGLDYDCEENLVYDTVTEGGLKVGVALSGSANGKALIGTSLKASSGQYIAGIDYKGAYLDFEFTSDKAESGVALSMRLSARFRTLYMSATTNYSRVDILVNGVAITYNDITITRPDNAQDMDGKDCEDYFNTFYINNIDLIEGENLIRIYVNNDTSRTDGTVRAYAPVVDCIYLSSTSELTFKEYENQ